MARILVTGGCGFIGSHLVALLRLLTPITTTTPVGHLGPLQLERSVPQRDGPRAGGRFGHAITLLVVVGAALPHSTVASERGREARTPVGAERGRGFDAGTQALGASGSAGGSAAGGVDAGGAGGVDAGGAGGAGFAGGAGGVVLAGSAGAAGAAGGW